MAWSEQQRRQTEMMHNQMSGEDEQAEKEAVPTSLAEVTMSTPPPLPAPQPSRQEQSRDWRSRATQGWQAARAMLSRPQSRTLNLGGEIPRADKGASRTRSSQ